MVSVGWLGTFGGILAILGVVAAPVTTGATPPCVRARLIVADFLGLAEGACEAPALSLPILRLHSY